MRGAGYVWYSGGRTTQTGDQYSSYRDRNAYEVPCHGRCRRRRHRSRRRHRRRRRAPAHSPPPLPPPALSATAAAPPHPSCPTYQPLPSLRPPRGRCQPLHRRKECTPRGRCAATTGGRAGGRERKRRGRDGGAGTRGEAHTYLQSKTHVPARGAGRGAARHAHTKKKEQTGTKSRKKALDGRHSPPPPFTDGYGTRDPHFTAAAACGH